MAIIGALVKEVISKLGLEIFGIVDHANNARRVGLNLDPTVVIYFGNPRVGTLLMQINREIAYELPLRILVWESNGVNYVGYKKPSRIAEEYGLSNNEIALKIDAVMENIISSI
ncbi:hypothetical protein DJ523_08240 [Sulfolobus sp. E5]|nr:hypothetical protein DJ523_08240 [Sulfolobus sp. E5]